MRALDLILKKRNGGELREEEIQFLIDGYVQESIPEYQISSLLMAIYFKGMNEKETSFLTQTMINSGEVMDLQSLNGYSRSALVDKHSTGGVGDKVSLILAPIVAAAGAQVPMMSGRGLGHTGGTLDKLESIPGYRTDLSPERFVEVIAACGFAMTAQSRKIVPADKKLYALRDVTGTVESIPLITASILSKKFAEGSQHLVFDVKYGAGAFMKTVDDAHVLAESLVRVGKEHKRGVRAVITNMDIPLGAKIGNFLEIEETIACLNCEGWNATFDSNTLSVDGISADLMEVTLYLSAYMLIASSIVKDFSAGIQLSLNVLRDGTALERFWKNVALQGGDRQKCEALIHKRENLFHKDIVTEKEGYLNGLNAYRLGIASVLLGAGRNVATDDVLPDVGIDLHAKPGVWLPKSEKVITLYSRNEQTLDGAIQYLNGIIVQDAEVKKLAPMIHSVI